MPKIPGLTQRSGTYYFRVRVPLDLVSVFKKAEIKESLKTKEFTEAKKRRNERATYWDAQFAAARNKLTDGSALTAKPLSLQDAEKLVQDYVRHRDREWRKREIVDGPENAKQKREMQIDLAFSKQMLTNPEDPRGEESISHAVEKVLAGTEIAFGEGGISRAEFYSLVRRALLELYRRSSARLKDDYTKPFFDHLFAQNDSPNGSAPAVTFGKLCAEYFDNYREGAQFKKIDQKRIDKIRSTLLLVEEIIGSNTPITEIDYDACVTFRNTLAKVPKNMRKHYRDMPFLKAIVAAENDGRPTMAYGTQQVYLQNLTNVLQLAAKKGVIPIVPSVGLSPHAEKVADEEKRKPFTADQLKAIFSAPLYMGCQDDGLNFSKSGPNRPRRARFWVPLIMLFTGMRPNEICQLYAEDMKVSEGGTYYFDIINDQSDKKLKNATSRRAFPVHPELKKIGLLSYVAEKKAKGEKRLFPELNPDKYGYYSTQLSDWFSQSFLKTVMKKDQRQSLYSLRHNFRDALRHAEAPDWILQALGAWNQGSKVSDNYGKKDWPDHLSKWVKKIHYPGLDLSHLHVKDAMKE